MIFQIFYNIVFFFPKIVHPNILNRVVYINYGSGDWHLPTQWSGTLETYYEVE